MGGLPSQENSIDLMQQASVVLCNSASSIHAEASMLGKAVICLLDAELMFPDEQKKKLKHLKNIYFHDYSQRLPVPDALIEQAVQCQPSPLLKSFNADVLENILQDIH